MKTTAIILAAGNGSRMQADRPKQFLDVHGKPMIVYTIDAFERSAVDEIILVTSESNITYCEDEIVKPFGFTKVTKVIAGGRERYDSVYQGLQQAEDGYVLIHDGARPCIRPETINRCIEELKNHPACVIGVPVKDTIKVVDKTQIVTATPDRKTLWQVQTPQCFHKNVLAEAFEKMYAAGDTAITDDAMVVEKYGNSPVKMVLGDYNNIKATTPEDMQLLEQILR
ncbi:MAG: 2-C-methyl-D-erythritol 4-phosphate cytidylyltransferase [Lachnospiraceae bacterium]|nr:2-C-methyl-D-erythritol 4-phosphate cytidylyltransferase [Lachnospiraceae bacterium]